MYTGTFGANKVAESVDGEDYLDLLIVCKNTIFVVRMYHITREKVFELSHCPWN